MSADHSYLISPERDIYSELLAASRQDVKTVGSGALAALSGYSSKSIDRMVRRRSSEADGRQQSLSLFLLADLLVFSDRGAFRVLQLLNELAGLIAVPMADGKAMPCGAASVACVSGDFAALLEGMSAALKDDNHISAEEIVALDLIEKAGELERAGAALRVRYRERVADAVKKPTGGGGS